MTQVPKDPLIGHVLEGRYAIKSRIARGGMAVVYEGVDQRLHRKVAIKIMHAHLAHDDEFKRRFVQEARNAAKLAHPNLVSMLDQGEESGIVFLVMEHIPGITLRDLLKKQGFLTKGQALEISEAMLQGLAAAHQMGLIHRDLKPENVLLADDGRIKLADFGLARAVDAATSTNEALLGTIAYLSPELVNRVNADKQSDIYAFGIMLYEMLTGSQPFVGERPMQVAYQHAHEPMPLPSASSTESNSHLDYIVQWATQKDPADRPRDASVLLRELHQETTLDNQSTTVMPTSHLTELLSDTTGDAVVLPQPAALNQQLSQNLDAARSEENSKGFDSNGPELPSAIGKAVRTGRRQVRKGILLALLLILLTSGAFAASWWLNHGPGSDVTVPNVVGEETQDAVNLLKQVNLTAKVTECNDVDMVPGLVLETTPGQGTRVARDSEITICESVGPALIATPKLKGLSIESAEASIAEASFKYGGLYSERFSSEPAGTVLSAHDADGKKLPKSYAEQSEIKLTVSLGELPSVVGLSISEAEEQIENAGLVLDTDSFTYDFSDEHAADIVLGLITNNEKVVKGDTVTLHISEGPELFEVPDVTGLTVREAVDLLISYGFDAKGPWYLNEAAMGTFTTKGTSPEAGAMVPALSEIEVKPKIL